MNRSYTYMLMDRCWHDINLVPYQVILSRIYLEKGVLLQQNVSE